MVGLGHEKATLENMKGSVEILFPKESVEGAHTVLRGSVRAQEEFSKGKPKGLPKENPEEDKRKIGHYEIETGGQEDRRTNGTSGTIQWLTHIPIAVSVLHPCCYAVTIHIKSTTTTSLCIYFILYETSLKSKVLSKT